MLEKLKASQLVKNFPACYGTRRFITAFKIARHMSLSWARSIQSIPSHHTSWGSNLILDYHLSMGRQNGPFPLGFSTQILYKPILHLTRYMLRPSHSSRLYLLTKFGEQYRSLRSTLYNFPHSPVNPSLWGLNILLNTLFSYTLILVSPLNTNDKFSHPYKIAGKIIVLDI
jgi:hypothetical protein